MKRTLPITEWHHMAQGGSAPPTRIQLNGCSMDPLIRVRKDYVTIMPSNALPAVGDIVLFADPGMERYVVHRVWKVNSTSVYTWGDNCPRPDGWIPLDNVWGKVVLIERGKIKIRSHPKLGMAWAWLWHQVMKIYHMKKRFEHRITGKE